MIAKLYIDKGVPLIETWPEKLSDGSEVWCICFRGGMSIDFASEAKCDAAFVLMVAAVKMSMEKVLVL